MSTTRNTTECGGCGRPLGAAEGGGASGALCAGCGDAALCMRCARSDSAWGGLCRTCHEGGARSDVHDPELPVFEVVDGDDGPDGRADAPGGVVREPLVQEPPPPGAVTLEEVCDQAEAFVEAVAERLRTVPEGTLVTHPLDGEDPDLHELEPGPRPVYGDLDGLTALMRRHGVLDEERRGLLKRLSRRTSTLFEIRTRGLLRRGRRRAVLTAGVLVPWEDLALQGWSTRRVEPARLTEAVRRTLRSVRARSGGADADRMFTWMCLLAPGRFDPTCRDPYPAGEDHVVCLTERSADGLWIQWYDDTDSRWGAAATLFDV